MTPAEGVKGLSGRIVLDASVVVEMTGEFTHPAAAREVLETAAADPDIELWDPDLVYAEAVSALRSLVGRGALEAAEAALGVERIVSLPLNVSGTAMLMEDAWELSNNVTIYDACYVALARRLGGTLVTADSRLASTVGGTADIVLLSDHVQKTDVAPGSEG